MAILVLPCDSDTRPVALLASFAHLIRDVRGCFSAGGLYVCSAHVRLPGCKAASLRPYESDPKPPEA